MSVLANIAPSINEIQTANFYFMITLRPPTLEYDVEPGSFSISNIQITGTDVSIDNLVLLSFTLNTALVAVNLPKNVKGDFRIDMVGTVSVGGILETIDYVNKTISYDTTGISEDLTYDTTPSPSTPTEVELRLSANRVSNGRTVIAEIEFNYDNFLFTADQVDVTAGATKGNATALDDRSRRWIVPITVPSTGEGQVEVRLLEDVVFYGSQPADAVIFYQSQIGLWIGQGNRPNELDPDHADYDPGYEIPPIEPGIETIKGTVLNHPINVKGDNVVSVDVRGDLGPLYHHWDSTNGLVYIRSVGAIDDDYDAFEFEIVARDETYVDGVSTGELVRVASLQTPEPPAPIIRVPLAPVQLKYGAEVDVDIQIDNDPSRVEVWGTWLGISYRRRDPGVNIYGNIPQRGTEAAQMIPGVNNGIWEIDARNGGGDSLPGEVEWVLSEQIKPRWTTVGRIVRAEEGDAFDKSTASYQVVGDPPPEVTLGGGSVIPPGLTLETEHDDETHTTTVYFSGTATTDGTYNFALHARNAFGTAGVIQRIIVTDPPPPARAPTVARNPANPWTRRIRQFPVAIAGFFDRGEPVGEFTLTSNPSNVAVSLDTAQGILSWDGASNYRGRFSLTIACINASGSAPLRFNFRIR